MISKPLVSGFNVVITTGLSSGERALFTAMIGNFDKNKDGVLSKTEYTNMLNTGAGILMGIKPYK